MPEERVFFRTSDEGGGLTLEGVLYRPGAQDQRPGVVVCHPHPQYGGSMDNNVVSALCDALAERHITTLRFNFRGVGRSEGRYGGGDEEQSDVLAALAFLASHPSIDAERIGLAGYSFGARVSIAVAEQDPRVKALAAVSSPARGLASTDVLASFARPKFFIVGDQDNIAASGELDQFVAVLPEPKQLQKVLGADHFWRDYEGAVGPAVAEFFASALTQAAP